MAATFKPEESLLASIRGTRNETKHLGENCGAMKSQQAQHAKTLLSDNFTSAHLLNRGCPKIVRLSAMEHKAQGMFKMEA